MSQRQQGLGGMGPEWAGNYRQQNSWACLHTQSHLLWCCPRGKHRYWSPLKMGVLIQDGQNGLWEKYVPPAIINAGRSHRRMRVPRNLLHPSLPTSIPLLCTTNRAGAHVLISKGQGSFPRLMEFVLTSNRDQPSLRGFNLCHMDFSVWSCLWSPSQNVLKCLILKKKKLIGL